MNNTENWFNIVENEHNEEFNKLLKNRKFDSDLSIVNNITKTMNTYYGNDLKIYIQTKTGNGDHVGKVHYSSSPMDPNMYMLYDDYLDLQSQKVEQDKYLNSLPFGGEIVPDEVIICAANEYKFKFSENKTIVLGTRHCDKHMQSELKTKHVDYDTEIQGFWTNKSRFVDRQEAWKIALKNKQIIRRVGGDTSKGGTLYSENLY